MNSRSATDTIFAINLKAKYSISTSASTMLRDITPTADLHRTFLDSKA